MPLTLDQVVQNDLRINYSKLSSLKADKDGKYQIGPAKDFILNGLGINEAQLATNLQDAADPDKADATKVKALATLFDITATHDQIDAARQLLGVTTSAAELSTALAINYIKQNYAWLINGFLDPNDDLKALLTPYIQHNNAAKLSDLIVQLDERLQAHFDNTDLTVQNFVDEFDPLKIKYDGIKRFIANVYGNQKALLEILDIDRVSRHVSTAIDGDNPANRNNAIARLDILFFRQAGYQNIDNALQAIQCPDNIREARGPEIYAANQFARLLEDAQVNPLLATVLENSENIIKQGFENKARNDAGNAAGATNFRIPAANAPFNLVDAVEFLGQAHITDTKSIRDFYSEVVYQQRIQALGTTNPDLANYLAANKDRVIQTIQTLVQAQMRVIERADDQIAAAHEDLEDLRAHIDDLNAEVTTATAARDAAQAEVTRLNALTPAQQGPNHAQDVALANQGLRDHQTALGTATGNLTLPVAQLRQDEIDYQLLVTNRDDLLTNPRAANMFNDLQPHLDAVLSGHVFGMQVCSRQSLDNLFQASLYQAAPGSNQAAQQTALNQARTEAMDAVVGGVSELQSAATVVLGHPLLAEALPSLDDISCESQQRILQRIVNPHQDEAAIQLNLEQLGLSKNRALPLSRQLKIENHENAIFDKIYNKELGNYLKQYRHPDGSKLRINAGNVDAINTALKSAHGNDSQTFLNNINQVLQAQFGAQFQAFDSIDNADFIPVYQRHDASEEILRYLETTAEPVSTDFLIHLMRESEVKEASAVQAVAMGHKHYYLLGMPQTPIPGNRTAAGLINPRTIEDLATDYQTHATRSGNTGRLATFRTYRPETYENLKASNVAYQYLPSLGVGADKARFGAMLDQALREGHGVTKRVKDLIGIDIQHKLTDVRKYLKFNDKGFFNRSPDNAGFTIGTLARQDMVEPTRENVKEAERNMPLLQKEISGLEKTLNELSQALAELNIREAMYREKVRAYNNTTPPPSSPIKLDKDNSVLKNITAMKEKIEKDISLCHDYLKAAKSVLPKMQQIITMRKELLIDKGYHTVVSTVTNFKPKTFKGSDKAGIEAFLKENHSELNATGNAVALGRRGDPVLSDNSSLADKIAIIKDHEDVIVHIVDQKTIQYNKDDGTPGRRETITSAYVQTAKGSLYSVSIPTVNDTKIDTSVRLDLAAKMAMQYVRSQGKFPTKTDPYVISGRDAETAKMVWVALNIMSKSVKGFNMRNVEFSGVPGIKMSRSGKVQETDQMKAWADQMIKDGHIIPDFAAKNVTSQDARDKLHKGLQSAVDTSPHEGDEPPVVPGGP